MPKRLNIIRKGNVGLPVLISVKSKIISDSPFVTIVGAPNDAEEGRVGYGFTHRRCRRPTKGVGSATPLLKTASIILSLLFPFEFCIYLLFFGDMFC